MVESVAEGGLPFADAPVASFVANDGPVYVLVGGILPMSEGLEDAPVRIQVAPGLGREYDPRFLPVFEFFQTPRTERQAREWMEWAGGDDEFFAAILDTRAVVRVDTRDPLAAAESLAGLRLIPQCAPVPGSVAVTPLRFPVPGSSVDSTTFIDVKRDPEDESRLRVTGELARAMWDLPGADLPQAIRLLAEQDPRLSLALAARRTLTLIPLLLQHGYARLEWLAAPVSEG